jgi:hypothetical protein
MFTGEQSYELGPDALRFRSHSATQTIPYSDIESVRVIDYANMGEVHGQCTLKARGRRKLKIRSHHFLSLGAFENRTQSYAPFVCELCRRVHAANPQARFLNGSGWLQILWLVVLGFSGIGWVMWLATIIEGGRSLEAVAGYFVGLSLATIFSWRWFVRSKPNSFDPTQPPFA